MKDSILPFLQFLYGFLNMSTCCLLSSESQGEAGEDRDLAVPSVLIGPVLLEPPETFDCFPGSRSLAGSLLGRFHRERWETAGVGCPLFSAFCSGTGPFVCRSEALLMQKECIQHTAPCRAVGIIMPLFIILKQTQFGVWISLEV